MKQFSDSTPGDECASPTRIPIPSIHKSQEKKQRKMSSNLPTSTALSERGRSSKAKRLVSDDQEILENDRKKSMHQDYVKKLDDLIPKPSTSISASKMGRIETESASGESHVRIIGVCGGACSGKTFIVKSIRNYLRSLGYQPTTIKERNFLLKIPVKDEDLTPEIISNYDFDHYKAIDWKLFESTIKSLSESKPFNCPIYSLFENRPIMKTKKLRPSNIVLIEGRLFLNNEFIRNRSNFVIYLDTDSDIMLSRIIVKNSSLKHHSLDAIVHKYTQFIKPNFDKFVVPTKKYADMIIYNFAGEHYSPTEMKEGFQFLSMVKDWLRLQIGQDEQKEVREGESGTA